MKWILKIPNKMMVYLAMVIQNNKFSFSSCFFENLNSLQDLDLNSEGSHEDESNIKLALYEEYEVTKLFDAVKACNSTNLYYIIFSKKYFF